MHKSIKDFLETGGGTDASGVSVTGWKPKSPQYYFAGSKTLEETRDMIENRRGLYLWEKE